MQNVGDLKNNRAEIEKWCLTRETLTERKKQ